MTEKPIKIQFKERHTSINDFNELFYNIERKETHESSKFKKHRNTANITVPGTAYVPKLRYA